MTSKHVRYPSGFTFGCHGKYACQIFRCFYIWMSWQVGTSDIQVVLYVDIMTGKHVRYPGGFTLADMMSKHVRYPGGFTC